MQIKISKLYEWLSLLFVFLIAIQFNNNPAEFVFALGVLIIIYFIYKQRMYLPSIEFIMLVFTFSVYFFIFKKNVDKVYLYHYAAYWLGPIVGYLAGYILVRESEEKKREIQKILMAICTGTILFAIGCIVNKIINIGMYNKSVSVANLYVTMTQRYSLNMWSNELVHPTNLNSLCIFVILLIFYVINYINDKKIRICYGVELICSIIVAMITATRTNLFFLPIFFAFSMFLSRKDIHFRITKGRFVILYSLVTIGLISIANLIDLFQNSLMATRTESLDNNRWNSIVLVLNSLNQYPMGNMPYSNAHNMWADVARVAGYIPMILLVIYTIMILVTLSRLVRIQNVEQEVKTLFQVLTIGLLVSFFIEPAVEGRPFNVMFFCLINGMCRAYIKTEKVNLIR